jgi:hypothetical protein
VFVVVVVVTGGGVSIVAGVVTGVGVSVTGAVGSVGGVNGGTFGSGFGGSASATPPRSVHASRGSLSIIRTILLVETACFPKHVRFHAATKTL